MSDMQYSQPHMTLYRADIFLSGGGRFYRSVEALILILFYASLASLIPPSYGGIAIYYEVLGHTLEVTILKPTVVQSDHQYKP